MRRRSVPVLLGLTLLVPPLLAGCAAGEPEADQVPEVIGAFPYSTTSAEVRAEILRAEHRFDMFDNQGAYRHAQKAIALDPLYGYAYYLAAVAAPGPEDYRANLRRAIENSGGASEEERLLIEAEQKKFDGDAEGQRQALEALVALDPENPRAHAVMGFYLYGQNRDIDSRASFRRALELAPDFAAAHLALAQSLVQEAPNDFEAAETHVARLQELVPHEPSSQDALGDLRRAQGRLAEARDAYTRQAELDTAKALPFGQRGHVNTFLGDYQAARADYARARDKGTRNEPAFYARYIAYTHVFAGEPDVALDSLRSALPQLEAWNVSSLTDQRIATVSDIQFLAMEMGRFDVAREALAQGIPLRRQQAEETGSAEFTARMEHNIALWEGYLAFYEGDDATALARADEAVRLVAGQSDPRRNEYAHTLMGLVALRQGRTAEAVRHLEQGNLDDPWTEYQYALALEAAGRAEEAMERFRSIADFRFNNLSVALVQPAAQRKVAARSST